MAVEFKTQSFATSKGFLVFPDHYVNVAHTFKQNDAAATDVGGRKIIKAGTVYPKNDATAAGLVWADYDVTDGDVNGALLIHGFVKTAALPVAPAANAITALKLVEFLPKASIVPSVDKLTVTSAAGTAVGATKLTVTPALTAGNKYFYTAGSNVPKLDQDVSTYTPWDGKAELNIANGTDIVVVEATAEGEAKKAGTVKVVAKADAA